MKPEEQQKTKITPMKVILQYMRGVGSSNSFLVEAIEDMIKRYDTKEGKAYFIYLIICLVVGCDSKLSIIPDDAIPVGVSVQKIPPTDADKEIVVKFDYSSERSKGSVCVKLSGTLYNARAMIVDCNSQNTMQTRQHKATQTVTEPVEEQTEEVDENDFAL